MRLRTFISAGIALCSVLFKAYSASPVDYVDTRVGSAYATTASAGTFGKGSEEHGQTIPAVGVPNGMNSWTPQTRDTEQKCIAPYYYADSRLQGFRNSHWINGGCTQDYGSMTILPMGSTLRTSPGARAALMDKKSETARPDYYSVYLPEEKITAEMTGLSRSGIFRFTYDSDGIGHIVVNPNSDEGQGMAEYVPESKEIHIYNPVHRIYQGWGEPAGFGVWTLVKLPSDLEVESFGTCKGDAAQPANARIENKKEIGVYVRFRTRRDHPITVKAASSFVSLEGARRNLAEEMPGDDFDTVRAASAQAWNQRLGRILVEGDSTEMRKFYGALYRASLLPRVTSDTDGSYPAFASMHVTHKMPPGTDYYDDFSMWDTYRALHPLITLIEPRVSGQMMNSLVTKAEEGGWMPIFPCWNNYTAAMIGDHCAAAIADAAAKGIEGFDLEKAYTYLRRNAFESPDSYEEYKNGMGRRALKSYMKYGYIPLEDGVEEAFHDNEQSSRTLEYAYDDFALSQIAGMLGQEKDRKELTRRSRNYFNVMDPKLGYANGRHADGSFERNTNPFDFNEAFTEGAPCHYTWYVPHDPGGLISALGGPDKFEKKLDRLFDKGKYWHGNEPCHQIAYLYNAVGRNDKTQREVRKIMETEYQDTPGGLSGNDDAGQMSAWYVFSALGFYPVCPSLPEYWLGAPAFESITITPEGGKPFVIKTVGKGPFTRLRVNGEEMEINKISHSVLTQGGEMIFE